MLLLSVGAGIGSFHDGGLVLPEDERIVVHAGP